jgi:hypothetical protein
MSIFLLTKRLAKRQDMRCIQRGFDQNKLGKPEVNGWFGHENDGYFAMTGGPCHRLKNVVASHTRSYWCVRKQIDS